MTETKRKRGRPKKQPYLSEEMAPPSIPEIDTAAEHYVSTRDERCQLSKDESEAHDNLLEKMKAHGLDRYEFEGYIVVAISKTKCAVKRKKDASANGETEED